MKKSGRAGSRWFAHNYCKDDAKQKGAERAHPLDPIQASDMHA
jgi:hypothetical protein